MAVFLNRNKRPSAAPIEVAELLSEKPPPSHTPPSLLVRENDRQEPLEGLFGVDGVGLAGGHYERLASLDLVLNAVYRVLAYTFQDIRPRVTNRLVGADLLTLVNTQRIRAQSRSGRICFANLRPFFDCSLMNYV